MKTRFFLLMVFLFLAACTNDEVQAPVVEGWLQPEARQDAYRVKEGDTLYSIAWAFGVDYRALAAANKLAKPYTIKNGQLLQMVTTANNIPKMTNSFDESSRITLARENLATKSVAPASQNYPISQKPPIIINETPETSAPIIVASPSSSNSGNVYSVKNPKNIPAKKPIFSQNLQQQKRSSLKASQPIAVRYSHSTIGRSSAHPRIMHYAKWQWPTRGKVIEGYSTTLDGNHGLNITGSLGQPIKAAASGEVVYSGKGVIGYGNLIIIKHSASYLSAYAYNQRLLVRLGQRIHVGQQIATMGQEDTGRAMLHFEIRLNGKPINPMTLLP